MGRRLGRCAIAMALAAAAVGMAPAWAQTAAAGDAPQLANIFADHAVIQRDRPIHIWGWAKPGDMISVQFGDAAADAKANSEGHWTVSLPAMPAGGPYVLRATAHGQSVQARDVMVGDVYLCSGQSNMEFPARLSTGAWNGLDGSANDRLRFAIIPNKSEPAVQRDLAERAEWKRVDPDNVGEASAVCYYMARSLQQHLDVPIGFVSSDWGGTTIQSWISADQLRTLPDYRERVALVDLLARDPTAARTAESQRRERWWDAHIPSAKAQRAWAQPGFDDAAWTSMVPSGGWKQSGDAALADFDGVLWYRSSVDLTAQQAASGTGIELGPIDSVDDVWVNGQWVGGGAIAWMWRNYGLPAGVLRAGRNVIAVRTLSDGQGGGMTGQPDKRGILLTNGAFVTLPAAWRYQMGEEVAGEARLAPPPWEPPQSLSTLYNAMIAPIAGYGFKLAAWYQGEANVGAAEEYAKLLAMMMADWRAHFAQPDLPFLIVQLSAFGTPVDKPVESGWARLRDVEAKVARADPHAAVATSIDVGDPTDVHPPQKNVVGERLARAARSMVYGEAVSPSGPYPANIARDGQDLVVTFTDSDGGLKSYSSDTAIGFESCTAANACRFAAGTIEGSAVRLSGANRPGVVKVRYAWSDAPFVNLFGANDLPAIPFERAIP